MNFSKKKILEVKNLTKIFKLSRKNKVKAVDNISFDIYEGETLGLVGESGSGKSTTGKTILGLYEKTAGEIKFLGKNISNLSKKEKFNFTKDIQIIFQDPMSSLNPRMKIGEIIAEGLRIHNIYKNKNEEKEKILEYLNLVGLNKNYINRFPHEFSGGQRQRIGIARALILEPKFIVIDEAISALDVSIQAQIVNLLKELQLKKKLTYLFIAHDLAMVKYISNRIAVMYKGKIVELADSNILYDNPLHEYTKSLLSCIPIPDPKVERNKKIIKFKEQNYIDSKLVEVEKNHFVMQNYNGK